MSHQPPEPPAPPPSPSPNDPERRRSQNAAGSRHEGVLKRTVVRPARPAPEAADSVFVANRLTSLTHELANLLEGSLRVVGLARRSLDRAAGTENDTPLNELGKRLDTLEAAMAQMAELVRASMMDLSGMVSVARMHVAGAGSLADAVSHAVEVMRPLADERCIRLNLGIDDGLSRLSAGPIYTVIVNGVRNAIEAIERRGGPGAGNVCVRAMIEKADVVLEIVDDGVGPPRGRGARGPEPDVFHPGFSTKPGGTGVGLAISEEVVRQMGGTILLAARENGERGAVLHVRFPAPPRLEG